MLSAAFAAPSAALFNDSTASFTLDPCPLPQVRPEVTVLKRLTLRLPRGKVTALVGRSGAGKSTVANLLSR